MRIGLNGRFLFAPQLTGVQRYGWSLLRALGAVPNGFHFTALVPDIPSGGSVPDVTLVTSPKWGFSLQMWEHLTVDRLARCSDLDLLHHPANTAPLRTTVPYVLTIHDVSVFRQERWYRQAFSAYYRFLLPRVARKARLVLTVSEFCRDEICETLRVPESRVMVVGNTLPPLLEPGAEPPPEDRPYVLTVGSLCPRKNLNRLLQAFSLIERHCEHDLIIVGATQSIYPQLRGSPSPRVLLAGRVSDQELSRLYAGASLFVFPSLYEGFGIPLLEAFANAVPVACSRTSALPEVAQDAALYFDPYRPDEIASAILQIIRCPDLAEDLRRKGRSRLHVYSPGRFRDAHIQAYRAAMAS